jgi:hypothetical protein
MTPIETANAPTIVRNKEGPKATAELSSKAPMPKINASCHRATDFIESADTHQIRSIYSGEARLSNLGVAEATPFFG